MEKITEAAASEATSIQLAPVTPNKCKGVQDVISLEERRRDASTAREFFPVPLKEGESLPSNSWFSWFLSQSETQHHERNGAQASGSRNFTSAPLAPVTPDKCKQIPSVPHPEIIDLVDDSESEENGPKEVDTNQPVNGQSLVILDPDTFIPEELRPCGTVQPSIQNMKQTGTALKSQGIDLNKTPPQKPRKKKHRPKVPKEGASARKAKQVTPKPTGTVETPSTKRKYTRRKDQPSSGKWQSDNQENKRARKSAKRILHFESEETREEVRNPTFELLSQKSQCSQNNYEGIQNANGSFHGSHVVESTSCRAPIYFNHSVKQVPNNHITSVEIAMQANLASRRARLRENLNNLALIRDNINDRSNSLSSLPIRLLPNHDLTQDSQIISNKSSNSQFFGNSTDFRGSHRNYNYGTNDFQITYRNLIMENPQMKKICSDNDNGKDRSIHCNGIEGNNRSSGCLGRTKTDDIYLMLNKQWKERCESNLTSSCPPSQSPSCNSGGKLSAPERLPFIEQNLNFSLNDRERKQPPKVPVQVRNFSSLVSGISCGQLPSFSKVPHLQSHMQTPINTEALLQTVRPIKSTGLLHKRNDRCPQADTNRVYPELPCRNHDLVSSNREDNPLEQSAFSGGALQQKTAQEGSPIIINFGKNAQRNLHIGAETRIKALDNNLLELVINKLKYLCISDGVGVNHQELQNALVPYNGNGVLVPYEDPSKKRKPRAKVDLDSETNRVWLLLMGKEGDLDTEGKDLDKEKWWEEERRVFRGRVDSFIARMHLVQGDRRFSPWKGSVVDSVVGVFLTQNVSDHLSSSAFMAVAAKFPVSTRKFHEEMERKKELVKLEDDAVEHQELQYQSKAVQHLRSLHRPQNVNETKGFESARFMERSADIGQSTAEGKSQNYLQKDTQFSVTPFEISMQPSFSLTESSLSTVDDRIKTVEFAPSSHSVISSQNSSDSPILPSDCAALITDLSSETYDPLVKSRGSSKTYPSFMEMLQMVGTDSFEELTYCHGGRITSRGNMDSEARVEVSEARGLDIWSSSFHGSYNLNDTYPCADKRAFQLCQERKVDSGVLDLSSSDFGTQPNSILIDINSHETRDISSKQSFASEITQTNYDRTSSNINCNSMQNIPEVTCQKKAEVSSSISYVSDLHKGNFNGPTSISKGTNLSNPARILKDDCATNNQQNGIQVQQSKEDPAIVTDQLPNIKNGKHLVPTPSSDAKIPPLNQDGQCMSENTTKLASKNSTNSTFEAPIELERQGPKMRKGRVEKEKKVFDWDSLRRATTSSTTKKERSSDRADSVDWEAVRRADVSEISSTIRERGMNNMLSERIKDFLDRLVREHGSIDLEWLRDVPSDQAKDYLLSIRGLGLKSVECVRLLTLHHLAFPVDTNVGRICVRLGWVPLQPLPESLQLHLLELYPLLETIQKYIWPRLCKLDQKTLYELHYQMITFGKVFCTKSKPNCNACPMRGECKHFASAFASARLPLPGPEEKRLVPVENPIASEPLSKPVIVPMPVAQLEGFPILRTVVNNCEPIIEEPATPEPECLESLETEIEDAFYEDPDEIPVIKLNIEQFTQNLHNIMQGTMELQGDMSKALVALIPEAASIPQPKLKNVSRLRTEHQVYELPDSHPLLEGFERREPDDPCPYLLAIWTPGETAQSTEPPDRTCSSRENGNLCDKTTCFACNSIREVQTQKVRGTLLIPCRTAMRGSFPLNGTYFQVNEVFADHSSSLEPREVPREWIWSLPRRTVYFGTSVPSIFRGLTTEGIQQCFWRGFICVRGFDQKTRTPRPLMARLHFPASKAMRNKRMPRKEDE